MKLTLSLLTLLLLPAQAGPPKIPDVKMKHGQKYTDKKTKEKKQFYKTDYSQGSKIWNASKKKYLKHGTFFAFHSNKSVSKVTTWNNGVRAGAFQAYNEKGILRTEGVYKSGEEEGDWKYYTDKGELHELKQYKNGSKNGKYITYYTGISKAKIPHFIVHYKGGDKNGTWEQYNTNGKLIDLQHYANDKRIKK